MWRLWCVSSRSTHMQFAWLSAFMRNIYLCTRPAKQCRYERYIHAKISHAAAKYQIWRFNWSKPTKKNKKVIFKHRFQHNLPTPHASKSKYLVQNAYVLSVTKSEHHQRPTDGWILNSKSTMEYARTGFATDRFYLSWITVENERCSWLIRLTFGYYKEFHFQFIFCFNEIQMTRYQMAGGAGDRGKWHHSSK